MRVIVTGGAGFIGSHVCEALVARGDEVHVVDDLSRGKREHVPPAATLHVADIRLPLDRLFSEIRPEGIVHLAAQIDVRVSVADPGGDALSNVLGTINVLEAARPHGARIAFSSTGGAIYGECSGPASEEAPRRPLAPYGTSKLAAEEYLATWNRLYGTVHVSLRLGNVYGPRQDPHGEAGVVSIFLQRLRDGQAGTIYGDGLQTRDYVYAGDVARAAVAALERGDGVYNVGTGHETNVVELWQACCAVAGVAVEPTPADARLGEIQRSVLDPARAQRELGWAPTTTLEAGLRATWEWIREE